MISCLTEGVHADREEAGEENEEEDKKSYVVSYADFKATVYYEKEETEEDKELKIKIIENLKSPYNKILFQYYIQEYTLDEIANINKTTKGTIKVQISRGKKIVEDILRKERL